MKKLLALAVLTALMACVSPALRAAEASKDKSARAVKPENKSKHIPFHGKISAVDKTAKTVALEGKERSRIYQITSETKITKDGKPAVLDDVTVGESVGGAYRENAAGKLEIVTLNVGAKAGKEKHEEKKGQKK